jgi:multidrug resistance efflux pump
MPSQNHFISIKPQRQAQYLLSNPPTWMMHYGITAIAVVFSVLLLLSYIIQYPDAVEAKVSLVTANPPIRIIAKNSGKVLDLLVNDNETVQKAQVLAVLENTAHWQDILKVEQMLQQEKFELSNNLNLGELQNTFSTFAQHYKDFAYFNDKNGVATKIGFLQQQITHLKSMNENLRVQLNLITNELYFAEKEVKRQQTLFAQGNASRSDLEKASTALLQQKRQVENSKASIISNNLQVTQLENQINDLRQNKNDKQNDKSLTLQEDIQKLRAAVEAWKNDYLVIAPIAGQVSMSKIWSPQQSVAGGEEIMAVVPFETNNTIIGKATLPIANAGKVAKGMKAIVQLDALPYQEHGVLEGDVINISSLPQKEDKEELYLLEISFPQPLSTSYHRTIPFRQEMSGKAHIISENRSILARIFDKWNDLMKNRS